MNAKRISTPVLFIALVILTIATAWAFVFDPALASAQDATTPCEGDDCWTYDLTTEIWSWVGPVDGSQEISMTSPEVVAALREGNQVFEFTLNSELPAWAIVWEGDLSYNGVLLVSFLDGVGRTSQDVNVLSPVQLQNGNHGTYRYQSMDTRSEGLRIVFAQPESNWVMVGETANTDAYMLWTGRVDGIVDIEVATDATAALWLRNGGMAIFVYEGSFGAEKFQLQMCAGTLRNLATDEEIVQEGCPVEWLVLPAGAYAVYNNGGVQSGIRVHRECGGWDPKDYCPPPATPKVPSLEDLTATATQTSSPTPVPNSTPLPSTGGSAGAPPVQNNPTPAALG